MNKTVDMRANKKTHIIQTIFKKYMIYILFIAIFAISSFASPAFLKVSNLVNILRQTAIYAIIAFPITMLIISGVTDLSPGSVAAFTGVAGIVAYVDMTTKMGVNPVLAGLMAVAYSILLGIIIGFVNGIIITKFKVPAFMATLAMMTSIRGAALLYTGGNVIYQIGDIAVLGKGSVLGIPIPVLIMLILFVIFTILLKKTMYGRYIYAIGGNEEAAVASGINVNKIRMISYIVQGAMGGLAGILLMCRLNTGQPTAGEGYEFDAITGAVLGGTSFTGGEGTMFGTLVGILIVGMINNIFNLLSVQSYYHQILKGVLIVVAVIIDMRGKNSKVTA
ncbi:ABC transporter permease [Qiania dongpingensis]|uniref:ABC transporter permease n=1 Tax=Qiania dongpingensis TaxID=2763669 RepID=A0A7G9G787_9FIRM|nr:ABC transporter permease [Qiania dongpingensis]QNM06669.1 ABC transporter permease [Qiania dongpingensis]